MFGTGGNASGDQLFGDRVDIQEGPLLGAPLSLDSLEKRRTLINFGWGTAAQVTEVVIDPL